MTDIVSSISTDQADEIVFGYDGFVKNIEWEQHRWYTTRLIVFRSKTGENEFEGAHYGFFYDEPATEMQEDQERFHGEPVPVFPVEAVEVQTIKYRPVLK